QCFAVRDELQHDGAALGLHSGRECHHPTEVFFGQILSQQIHEGFLRHIRTSKCAFPSAEHLTTSWRKPARETSPFEPGPSAHIVVELFLGLCLLRSCRRTVALTEALPASGISPLDKTRSQIIAPAVAANQFF